MFSCSHVVTYGVVVQRKHFLVSMKLNYRFALVLVPLKNMADLKKKNQCEEMMHYVMITVNSMEQENDPDLDSPDLCVHPAQPSQSQIHL